MSIPSFVASKLNNSVIFFLFLFMIAPILSSFFLASFVGPAVRLLRVWSGLILLRLVPCPCRPVNDGRI